MNNIEIKIWANPQGFMEVTRQLPSVIFTPEEKSDFRPDSYDPIIASEFYSIFYAKNSYVVSCHFLTRSRLEFRDNRTILSIAIPRRYSFSSPIDSSHLSTNVQTNLVMIFTDLRRKYEELLNRLTDINELTITLTQAVPEWISEYSSKLVLDANQPYINMPGTTNAKGYVLYDSSLALQQYLEAPVRLDFQGASLMLVLPSESIQQNTAFLRYFTRINVDPKYRARYKVYFPAYSQTEHITIINSLEDSIERTFSKKYCDPITLSGRYIDHEADWKIERTSDNCGFSIGLKFKEQEFHYRVNIDFRDLNGQPGKARDVDTWLQPSVGRIVSKEDGYYLILIGAEKDSMLTFTSNRENYILGKGTISSTQINIPVNEGFHYNIPELKSIIDRKYHFSPQVYLSNGQQWIPYDSIIPLSGDRKLYHVKIAESEEYKEKIFSMAEDLRHINLEKKTGTKLTVLFKGDILKWLEADDRRKVVMQEEEPTRESKRISLNLDNNEIELLPFNGSKNFCFTAPGFKKEYLLINANKTELELDMQVEWWKKFMKPKFLFMLVCLIVGYLLGCFFPFFKITQSKKGNPVEMISKEDADRLARQRIEDGSSKKDAFLYDQDDKVSGNDLTHINEQSSLDPVSDNTPVSDVFKTGTVERNGSAKKAEMSEELQELINKLNGIEYTQNDIDNAKKLIKKEGKENDYKKFFADRTSALSIIYQKDRRKNAESLKNNIESYSTLTSEQKDAIQTITKDWENFSSLGNRNYKTLRDVKNALN